MRGPGDCFDSRALVQGGGSNAFVAREETLCHLLPREVTLRLINHNARFAAFFHRDISRKLDAAMRGEDAARFSPLMNAADTISCCAISSSATGASSANASEGSTISAPAESAHRQSAQR